MNARRRPVTGNLAPLPLKPKKLVISADLARRSGRLRLLAWGQDRRHRSNIGVDPGSVKHPDTKDRVSTASAGLSAMPSVKTSEPLQAVARRK